MGLYNEALNNFWQYTSCALVLLKLRNEINQLSPIFNVPTNSFPYLTKLYDYKL